MQSEAESLCQLLAERDCTDEMRDSGAHAAYIQSPLKQIPSLWQPLGSLHQ